MTGFRVVTVLHTDSSATRGILLRRELEESDIIHAESYGFRTTSMEVTCVWQQLQDPWTRQILGPKDFLVGVSNLSWLCLECSIQLQHRRSRWHFPKETSWAWHLWFHWRVAMRIPLQILHRCSWFYVDLWICMSCFLALVCKHASHPSCTRRARCWASCHEWQSRCWCSNNGCYSHPWDCRCWCNNKGWYSHLGTNSWQLLGWLDAAAGAVTVELIMTGADAMKSVWPFCVVCNQHCTPQWNLYVLPLWEHLEIWVTHEMMRIHQIIEATILQPLWYRPKELTTLYVRCNMEHHQHPVEDWAPTWIWLRERLDVEQYLPGSSSKEETGSQVERRYLQSTQSQVSDPDLWAVLHCRESSEEENTMEDWCLQCTWSFVFPWPVEPWESCAGWVSG